MKIINQQVWSEKHKMTYVIPKSKLELKDWFIATLIVLLVATVMGLGKS